jgi:hypothetical protein
MGLYAGSTLRSYSTDITRARLVITQLPPDTQITFLRPPAGSREYAQAVRDPKRRDFIAWLDQLPKGVDVAVGAGVTIDGVEFDCVHKGGIMVQDRSAVGQWKNVFWGPNNLAAPGQLIADMPGSLVRGHGY